MKSKEKEEAKRKEEAAKLRSYDYVMKQENMTTNEVSNITFMFDCVLIGFLFFQNGYDSDEFM